MILPTVTAFTLSTDYKPFDHAFTIPGNIHTNQEIKLIATTCKHTNITTSLVPTATNTLPNSQTKSNKYYAKMNISIYA